jgi:hypothetical protein
MDRSAPRTAPTVERHQSSASCSCHPGRGTARENSTRPSATARPSRFHTTAFVAVVDVSTPITNDTARIYAAGGRATTTGVQRAEASKLPGEVVGMALAETLRWNDQVPA